MKSHIYQFLHNKERGQAIILVAFAIIGLVAMVGLVVDTGVVFIEYGKLKRGVDAAAIAAAQQFRSVSGGGLDPATMEEAARNFMQLNQSDVTEIAVHSCEDDIIADRPALCNDDPEGHEELNRKLVQVTASKQVDFAFLPVIGINSTTISANAVGEAAALDLVLIIDTSSSMAYETSGLPDVIDPGDDPALCNYYPEPYDPLDPPCEPMNSVKIVAKNFINTMYFPYDRVAIIVMTSQVPGGLRDTETLLPLESTKAVIVDAIDGINVFEPRICDGSGAPGSCSLYDTATDPDVYSKVTCEIWNQQHADPLNLNPNPSSCNSSDVGGTLRRARNALSAADTRPEAFWVVVGLFGGPANVSSLEPGDPDLGTFPFGYCPRNTWLISPVDQRPKCRDRLPGEAPGSRHEKGDTVIYDNPRTPLITETDEISVYDADDFARDQADDLANLISGGVTIYTIGLGNQVRATDTSDAFYDPPRLDEFGNPMKIPAGEDLLQYIAESAGNAGNVHGQYFYAPDTDALNNIFELIAVNIATRISQ